MTTCDPGCLGPLFRLAVASLWALLGHVMPWALLFYGALCLVPHRVADRLAFLLDSALEETDPPEAVSGLNASNPAPPIPINERKLPHADLLDHVTAFFGITVLTAIVWGGSKALTTGMQDLSVSCAFFPVVTLILALIAARYAPRAG